MANKIASQFSETARDRWRATTWEAEDILDALVQ